MEGFKNVFYASDVIKDQPENFDGVEVNGVAYDRDQKPHEDGRYPVVVDNEQPDFFSAYVRHKDGRGLSVCDTGTHAECLAWANQIAARYENHGWTVIDWFSKMHH